MGSAEILARNPVFAHLERNRLNDFVDKGEARCYKGGDWIAHYGDIWPFLFLINSGEVRAVKESFEGRSLILTTLRAGEVFWGAAFLLEDACNPAAFTAAQDCELTMWPRERVRSFFLEDGRMSWKLACLTLQRAQLASEIVEKLAFQPVAGRLARLLVDVFGEEPQGPVARSLTLEEMAARIGTTREVVCRFLHRFSDQGLIEITRTEFSVKDRKGLQDLAQQLKN